MTYEEALPRINILLKKNKYKWQLNSISWISYEDIEQIIRVHFFRKWEMFDQEQSLEAWANTIIHNQLLNLQRNIYFNFVRPCQRCPANEGGDLCSIYGTQCNKCNVFAKWEKNKKHSYNVNLPLSLENHQQEVFEKPDEHYDISKDFNLVHKKMKDVLNKNEYIIYECLFIKNLSEADTAKKVAGRGKPNYALISQTRKIIIKKAKEILGEMDL